MLNLGTVRPGTVIEIPFDSFDGGTGASITLTGLLASDIEVYKDGSMTQRASDAGYTLLDTDGIDLDTITGIHGFTIDLADNTTAGFWAAGSRYYVVISSVTIDAQTVNFVAATFRIGYPDAIINTTIATLASQTSFTLTDGPAEDDALNGCVVCIHDVASKVQLGFAVVSDYTGSTKTVTLTTGVTFTAAATDNIAIFPPVNTRWFGTTLQTANDVGADVDAILVDTGTTLDGRIPAALVSGRMDSSVGAMAANVLTAAAINADAITDAKVASDVTIASVTGSVGSIATGGIAATSFAAGAIDAAAIAANAIGAAEIADGAIDAATFAAGAIDAAAIAADAIGASELAAGAVDEILDDVLTDSVPADGSLPTVRQALYMITQFLYERSVSGTTVTVNKVDGTTALLTLTLNNATTPTSITRAT